MRAVVLQAAQIPCDAASITEMIKLMDANRDGCISWDEFEAFMMNEFAAGQQLLSGEFVLPSGTLVWVPPSATHTPAVWCCWRYGDADSGLQVPWQFT